MLQCTQTAAMGLRELGRQQGVPATYGVRVFAAETPDGDLALGIGFAERPAEGDQVDLQHGTRIFIAEELADELAQAELDLAPDNSNNGNSPAQLVLRDRPSGNTL